LILNCVGRFINLMRTDNKQKKKVTDVDYYNMRVDVYCLLRTSKPAEYQRKGEEGKRGIERVEVDKREEDEGEEG
jgi:hypothetical protein